MSLENYLRFHVCFLQFGKYFYESSLPAHHPVDLCNYDAAAESANSFNAISEALRLIAALKSKVTLLHGEPMDEKFDTFVHIKKNVLITV